MSQAKSLFSNIRGDVFGGLTAGVVALPLALAFGEQTELGAIAGLYGAIALGVLAAVFGGTRTQISGPTAPMTVVSAVVIAESIERVGSFEEAFPVIVATFFLAGALQVLFGVFRLGQYIRYMPYPVVSGFMSGIGVIIVITQIFPFLGVAAPAGGPMGTIRSIHLIPEIVNVTSVMVALLTIGIIYGLPRITKAVPSALVALVGVSALAFFTISPDAILRINSAGPIPTGLPSLRLDLFGAFAGYDRIVMMLEFAFTLAALGAIDSLLTSLVADNMTKTRHDSNREMIGQGIGNMGGALIGGLPGAGATMRTVINIKSGGQTQISGVIAGLFLLAVLLGLGTLVGHVPNAVLAGILITVGIGIVDYKGLRHIRAVPRTDAVVMLLVLALTVFVDLLIAVAAGVVLAALLFMKSTADVVEHRTRSAPIREFSPEIAWADEQEVLERFADRVVVKHLDGPLFFGFASRFQEMTQQLRDLQVVVLRMERVPYLDQSGFYALREAVADLRNEGIEVVISGLHGQPLEFCRLIGFIPNTVSEDQCFETFQQCAEWLEHTHGKDAAATAPGGSTSEPQPV